VAALALAWPSQGKIAQAEKQLDSFLESYTDLESVWKLRALQVWLAARAGRDAGALIAVAREALPEAESNVQVRVRALLEDLSGQWAPAIPLYRSVDLADSAGLAWVRLGDASVQAGDFSVSGEQYAHAHEIWKMTGSEPGLALVAYRRAELAWLGRTDAHQALSLLEESLDWLSKSPPALQTGPRVVVQNALARIKKRQTGPWDAWQWQPFTDLACIDLLLPIFN
jgi:tetratricopeptide (TPR) repeat protein